MDSRLADELQDWEFPTQEQDYELLRRGLRHQVEAGNRMVHQPTGTLVAWDVQGDRMLVWPAVSLEGKPLHFLTYINIEARRFQCPTILYA